MARERLTRDESLSLYHRLRLEADSEVQRIFMSLLIESLAVGETEMVRGDIRPPLIR